MVMRPVTIRYDTLSPPFCFRLLPKIIGWYLIQKYKIQIQFGRISFPFSLRDVKILKNGYSLVSSDYL